MADKDGAASVALVVPPITASRSASKSISDLAAESERIGKVGGGGGEVGGWRGKGEGNMRGETRERESESEREREKEMVRGWTLKTRIHGISNQQTCAFVVDV